MSKQMSKGPSTYETHAIYESSPTVGVIPRGTERFANRKRDLKNVLKTT